MKLSPFGVVHCVYINRFLGDRSAPVAHVGLGIADMQCMQYLLLAWGLSMQQNSLKKR